MRYYVALFIGLSLGFLSWPLLDGLLLHASRELHWWHFPAAGLLFPWAALMLVGSASSSGMVWSQGNWQSAWSPMPRDEERAWGLLGLAVSLAVGWGILFGAPIDQRVGGIDLLALLLFMSGPMQALRYASRPQLFSLFFLTIRAALTQLTIGHDAMQAKATAMQQSLTSALASCGRGGLASASSLPYGAGGLCVGLSFTLMASVLLLVGPERLLRALAPGFEAPHGNDPSR